MFGRYGKLAASFWSQEGLIDRWLYRLFSSRCWKLSTEPLGAVLFMADDLPVLFMNESAEFSSITSWTTLAAALLPKLEGVEEKKIVHLVNVGKAFVEQIWVILSLLTRIDDPGTGDLLGVGEHLLLQEVALLDRKSVV